jgi:AhpD family alkylhydroperoxidase
MLPKTLRFWLFDKLSLKTMRYVDSVPRAKAKGLVAQIYRQIERDFFINGSLTSRSKVPNLLAAIWAAGREIILADDKLDRTTKEALAATISGINECPYCGDMLVSLVHAGEQKEAAMQIFTNREEDIKDPVLRDRLIWVKAAVTPGVEKPRHLPFSVDELPEAIGTIMAMGDINRFSHIVMAGSPVNEPFGITKIKAWALRRFGDELKETHSDSLEPGLALTLLENAELPVDLQWASSNPRVADTLARWTATVERESGHVISEAVKKRVHEQLTAWDGEPVSLSRSWVEKEVDGLSEQDKPIAKLALVLAKASFQIDEKIVYDVLGTEENQERFIRILTWCSFTASRYVARRIADLTEEIISVENAAA